MGQVRFENKKDVWEIGYSISKLFRGKGLGGALLDVALRGFKASVETANVMGQVKVSNKASRKVFERLGFDVSALDEAKIEYRRAL